MNNTTLDFDQADRMRRALRVSGVSVQDMADHLRVTRNTIGNWINGRSEPRPRDLTDFALKTGVPAKWITTGTKHNPGDYIAGVTSPARRRSHVMRPRNRVGNTAPKGRLK